jgi:hypothetical protein
MLQYKVDGDEECHNPSEPSTTFCPLLPGQRLNVLELPSEGHSRSNSAPSDGFTRNPKDRFLNPVPPAPLGISPHSALASLASHSMPLPTPWAPRSATYPPPDVFLTPNVLRHARSASASPYMPSTPLFTDFKCLKDKLASRSRSSSKPQELEISMPVLVSTTNEDLNLIPLGQFQAAPTSAPREAAPTTITVTRPTPTHRNGFNPLGSNPVNPVCDAEVNHTTPAVDVRPSHRRRRSHVPSTIITSEFKLDRGRIRANSADTRRTQHYLFSNDPWLSTPKLEQGFEADDVDLPEIVQPAPTLQTPSSLAPPSVDERPTSSHGSSRTPSLRRSPLDKALPALPRYVTPAPLFACRDMSPIEAPTEEPFEHEEVADDENDDSVLGDLIMEYQDKPHSHFSTWSSDSAAYTYSTSEDDGVSSPTFSSLTSNCSDVDLPQRFSMIYTYAEPRSTTEQDISAQDDELSITHLSTTPPRLDDLRISAFGSDLLGLDIQHAAEAPRRQAACFGLGFQYSLPEGETCSKSTITAPELRPEPSVQRESSVSQLNKLMDEFGYLGDAVI